MTACLEGIRVLDLSQLYPGPLCTMILADLGAEVVKVEPADGGDPARVHPFLFDQINRNKKSLALNLKHPRAQEAFRRLAEKADVVVEGFRPGTTSRLGVDYETLRALNPRLIYCSISGFGQDGPYRDRPGHDINYLAIAGVLGLTRDRENRPVVLGIEIADIVSALNAVIGILAALLARERTGEGQLVDISMLDCAAFLLHNMAATYLDTGDRSQVNLIHALPHYGVFETSDSQYLVIGIVHEDWFWQNLCDAVGMDDVRGMSTLERMAEAPRLRARLEEAIRSRKLEEWMRILSDKDVPCSRVHDVAEALDDPQVRHRRMVVELEEGGAVRRLLGNPYKLSATPPRIHSPAPRLGRHTKELLQEAGFSEREIRAMEEEGAARQAE